MQKHNEKLSLTTSPENPSGICPCNDCQFVRQYNNECPIETDWVYIEYVWNSFYEEQRK